MCWGSPLVTDLPGTLDPQTVLALHGLWWSHPFPDLRCRLLLLLSNPVGTGYCAGADTVPGFFSEGILFLESGRRGGYIALLTCLVVITVPNYHFGWLWPVLGRALVWQKALPIHTVDFGVAIAGSTTRL